MYRFKYYFKDGTIDLSKEREKTPEMMYFAFKSLVKKEDFNSFCKKNLTTHDILKSAFKIYKGRLKEFYKIEIINDETDEIVDYIDDSEAIINGQEGHVLYDANTGEIIGGYTNIERDHRDLVYTFKYYYNDGTSEVCGGKGKTPELLYNDFDGLMEWDEFYALSEKNLSTHEILELAFKLYENTLPKFYRIEIINDKTNEVVDYIDKTEEEEVK